MGRPLIDITGERFGRLTVLRFAGYYSAPNCWNRTGLWECQCDCGKEVIVRGTSLRMGRTKSCGCWNRDLVRMRALARREIKKTKGEETNGQQAGNEMD